MLGVLGRFVLDRSVPALPLKVDRFSTVKSTHVSQNLDALFARVEAATARPIRPLSIDEILALHLVSNATTPSPLVFQRTANNVFGGSCLVDSCEHAKPQDRSQLLLRCANWARSEIPLRLAHRLQDFSRIPFVVVANTPVLRAFELYVKAFTSLDDFPRELTTHRERREFTCRLRKAVAEHVEIVALMQRGVAALRRDHPDIHLDDFLNRLFGTRLGNRVLAETTLAVSDEREEFDRPQSGSQCNGDYSDPSPIKNAKSMGIIQRNCHPATVLRDVTTTVQQLSMFVYGRVPEVKLVGDLELTFPFVPEHLKFVCFEILKNAVRATVETHPAETRLPPVAVGIHKGQAHVVIKVADEGGGIPQDLHQSIWQYGFSTVGTAPEGRQMAGYGFGLPLSRLYTKYLGGDLDVKFMPGYGSDAYIFLPRLGHQRENATFLQSEWTRGSVPVAAPQAL